MTDQQQLIEHIARRVLACARAGDLPAARALIDPVPMPKTLALAIATIAVENLDPDDGGDAA